MSHKIPKTTALAEREALDALPRGTPADYVRYTLSRLHTLRPIPVPQDWQTLLDTAVGLGDSRLVRDVCYAVLAASVRARPADDDERGQWKWVGEQQIEVVRRLRQLGGYQT